MGDDFDIFDFFDFDDDGAGNCGRFFRGDLPRPKNDEWLTLEWEIIKIKKLKTPHLRNILNFIIRTKKRRKIGGVRMVRLEGEARKRGLFKDGPNMFWRSAHGFDVIVP